MVIAMVHGIHLTPMIVTGDLLIPSKPRYTDPDFEKDLNTACTTGQ